MRLCRIVKWLVVGCTLVGCSGQPVPPAPMLPTESPSVCGTAPGGLAQPSVSLSAGSPNNVSELPASREPQSDEPKVEVIPNVVAPGPCDCTPAPQLQFEIAGKHVEPTQMTGNSSYCGGEGDGVALDSLEPIQVQSGAKLRVSYSSAQEWEGISYTVFQGETKLAALSVRAGTDSLSLPVEPGSYSVVISGHSPYGWVNEAFRLVVLH